MIAEIADRGCDFAAEFAIRFPTEVFLTVIGPPTEDVDLGVTFGQEEVPGIELVMPDPTYHRGARATSSSAWC